MIQEPPKPKEIDLSNVRYIISDWDGTLADSWPEATAAFTHVMLEKFGIDPKTSEEYYNETAGRALSGQIKDAAKRFKSIDVENTEELESAYFTFRMTLPPPKVIEGAPEALKELKEKRFTIVVWSGTRSDVLEDAIEKTGLKQYINFSIGNYPGSDVMVKGKGLFAQIAKHLGLSTDQLRSQSVVIGDGKGDIDAGREVGCPTIAIPKKPEDEKGLVNAGADFIVSKISDLPALLRK